MPRKGVFKTEKAEKRSPIGRIRERAEAFFGMPYVECRGFRSVTVEGAQKIESMTQECVVVLLDRGRLAVCGENLICASFRNGCLTVDGEIDSVGKWRREA